MSNVEPMSGRLPRPDGAEIDYTAIGQGPALLFCHGLGGSKTSWDDQVAFFAARHRVVVFSHRGFAASTAPGGTPHPAAFAGDAMALLDHLGIDRAVVVGQSMGGWTAVELALAAPDRVAGLVLACTSGSLSFDGFADVELSRWREASPRIQADLMAAGIHVACGARLAETQPERHRRYLAIDAESPGLDKTALRAKLHAMRRRGRDDAVRIGCPVLAVTGEEDCLIPPRGVALVLAGLPQAQVVTVPRAGHSVYFEMPAFFNGLVGTFLGRIGWTMRRA